MYVDDEGLYVENQVFFGIAGCPQPLAGRGLILGTDDEGDSTDCTSSLDTIKKMVTWLEQGATSPRPVMEFFGFDDIEGLTDKELLTALGVK